ncbi:ferritin-like domain-containing protein [uncultured Algimonas sp.]|uniref:ferritin-like domain-containing protein n=1 Tax=uncultured Algimonas sp. TaxID=1547920 RepID=UPI00261E7A64|nr:ferritin-like domain-containing protein [uncultured Algimonas sp.]
MRPKTDPLSVLCEGDPWRKARAARAMHAAICDGATVVTAAPPDRPSRPDRPRLVPARSLAKRKLGSEEGRAALLHAIAHIELNAIDLAADMIARFSRCEEVADRRGDFIRDWSSVCDDEARHFVMVSDRLEQLGHSYGDFPAHGGLWDAALKTRGDIAARLSVAPLVLEARGLDVTPGMIDKLVQAGDTESADVLRVIYREEIGHVATGMTWLRHVAAFRQLDCRDLFRGMVVEHYDGVIRPPLNHDARHEAGLELTYYNELTLQPRI